ncbi:MAG: helix-turn-helix transcriptional regulator [Hyphomicrobiales bacterium]|nr:helix-turn-helix transcriptional regulator [Hyphomicrobiales bacterium]
MRNEIYSLLNQHLSARLRQARIDAGVTQVELANMTGRTQAYVSKFERGQLRLDVSDFITFTKCLNIDAHALLSELAEIPSDIKVADRHKSPHELSSKLADAKLTGKEFLVLIAKALENETIPSGKKTPSSNSKPAKKKKK